MQFNIDTYNLLVCEQMNKHPCLRHGQTLFNVLHEHWPDSANKICGTDLDPFYTTDVNKINSFFEWLMVEMNQ